MPARTSFIICLERSNHYKLRQSTWSIYIPMIYFFSAECLAKCSPFSLVYYSSRPLDVSLCVATSKLYYQAKLTRVI
jgi:hypothetical protein